jgi:acyl-CoA reductase-like NAD-dependent aldehyde dehydrogenase
MSDMMSGPDTAPRRGGGHRGSLAEQKPHQEERALFLRAADIVERRAEEITALLPTETGCAAAFAGAVVLRRRDITA